MSAERFLYYFAFLLTPLPGAAGRYRRRRTNRRAIKRKKNAASDSADNYELNYIGIRMKKYPRQFLAAMEITSVSETRTCDSAGGLIISFTAVS